MEYKIREMTENDWDAVSKIYQAGIDTHIATFQESCPAFEEWDRSHRPECRLVLAVGGKVAGWTALTPVSSRCVYAGVAEVSIYISPEYSGQGYGTLLLGRLVQEAEEHGYWMLQSGILQHNTASIRLHEKCGFRTVGIREKIARDHGGVWRNTILMEYRSRCEKWN